MHTIRKIEKKYPFIDDMIVYIEYSKESFFFFKKTKLLELVS